MLVNRDNMVEGPISNPSESSASLTISSTTSSTSSSTSSQQRARRGSDTKEAYEEQAEEEEIYEERTIEFSMWDFSGYERYYATQSFFLDPRAIYLVVFKMIDPMSLKRLEYWLNMLKKMAMTSNDLVKNDPMVVLVGTHLDDRMCDPTFVAELTLEINERYVERYPFIKSVAFVSCQQYVGSER